MNRAHGPHPEALPQLEHATEDAEVLALNVDEQQIALEGTAQAAPSMRARIARRAADRLEHRRAFNEQLADTMVSKLEGSEPAETLVPQNWFERRAERKAHKKLQEVKNAEMRMRVEDVVHGGKGMGRVKHLESRQSKKDLREDIHKMRREGSMSSEEAYKKLSQAKYDARVYKDSRAQRKARDELKTAKYDLVKYAAQPTRSKARAGLERRLRNTAEKTQRNHRNQELAHIDTPEYYLDSANVLSLKRSIDRESNRRLNERLHAGLVVSRAKIETQTALEGVARYFGFNTWEEAEEKVPGWLMDGVMQLYGYSEQELEAEAARERAETERPAPHSQPTELSHDEPVDLLRTAVRESAENNTHESSPEPTEETVDTATLDFIKEISNPENRGVVYENEIKLLARDIQSSIMRFTENIKDPAEKREIIDEIYTDYIADFLGVPQHVLRDPDIVPTELTSQILHDIKAAKQELGREETEEAGRIAYNVAQRVSFRFAEQTRDKELTDKQKEDIRLTLFTAALADELGVAPEDLDNLSASEQNLKKKVLARIDQNEKERLERVAKMRAEEAAKTPEQRRIDADNAALDKLRGTIND